MEARRIAGEAARRADSHRTVDEAERARQAALDRLRCEPCEDSLWQAVVAFQSYAFRTYSGLPFSYQLKKGRDGQFTRELFIDRRENSKSLAWSSVCLAFSGIREPGAVVTRPKALGDIRGITYIYGIFYRFGLIDVPPQAKAQMEGRAAEQLSFLGH